MAREYFCAYHSYLEAMEQLNDTEKGRLFTACLVYSKTGEVPQLPGNERFVFPSMKSQIDRDIESYNAFVQKQAENGKKGGRPKKSGGFSEKPTESQKTQAFFGKPKKAKEKEKEKEKAKEKEKEIRDIKDFCSEPSQASGLNAAISPVVSLILNDKSLYPVSEDQAKRWEELFPAVDVMQELRNMAAWCEANPQKRKTKSGIVRFITGWLSKEQNKGRNRLPEKKNSTYDIDELEELSRFDLPDGL